MVVVALLACHGALGALHVVPNVPEPAVSGSGHPVAHQASEPGGDGAPESDSSHTGSADCAVVLFIFLSGAALWSLAWVNRGRRSTAPRRPLHVPLIWRSGSVHIRGPDAPTLQVFRI